MQNEGKSHFRTPSNADSVITPNPAILSAPGARNPLTNRALPPAKQNTQNEGKSHIRTPKFRLVPPPEALANSTPHPSAAAPLYNEHHKVTHKLLIAAALLSALSAHAAVDFNREVRPIFEKSCFTCHGPERAMGKLRLDNNKASTSVVRAGHPEDSPLYRRVAGIGTDARMPMGGQPLSAADIATIKSWIEQGADWPDLAAAAKPKHWAFIPPQKPAIPKTARPAANPIDSFILARLEKESLAPSPEAPKTALLRRLSLDLTGLPPTLEELSAFLNDKSPRAYERQVDRLLKSNHYGERWARIWLDAARYADSDGYEKDKPRFVWFYRDYVINAFNRDLSYKQFLTEQLAGDLLPNPTQDQIVATGFLRNSMINEEGGVEPEQFRMEAMFDRMDAFGKAMLGLTIQCSQCHNHKFDPFTQEDYYRTFAFLNNSHEGSVAVYTAQEQIKRADLFRRIAEVESGLQHRSPDWQDRMAKWEQQAQSNLPRWTTLKLAVDDISNGGQKYLPMKDDSLLAQGYAPTKHRVKLMTTTPVENIAAFRLELMNDPNLPMNGPGRSILGTGALTEFEVEAAPAGDPKKITKIKFVRATADINLPEEPLLAMYDDRSKKRRVTGPIEYAIDGKDETSWGWDNGPARRNLPHNAVFTAEKPFSFPGGTALNIYLKQNAGGWNSDDNQNCNLGRIRLSITTDPNAVADPLPKNVRDILSIPRERRSPSQTAAVFSYWRTTVPEWKDANETIEALWREHPQGASQLALQDRDDRRDTHMLFRGDFLKPGKEVTPGTPAFLNPFPKDAPKNRLGLAQWLTDRNAPTTARSIVNRIWQAYFGTGLSSTSEDLGTQSETPSHPELLDWLAVDFMDHGWSLKQLHKTIVMSATYRQSSRVSPELLAKDPYNRLLARGPRFRVDAEIVRDIALRASGLLNEKIGGPSVNPPAPEFLFQPPTSYGPKIWNEAKNADRYRRALYTFRYRSVPYPMLQTFDAPNGDAACVRRSRSNTPLQALTTLNEPLFQEAARALALRTVKEGGATDEAKLSYAFRRCLSRPPAADEQRELLGLFKRQAERLSSGKANAWELIDAKPEWAVALPNNTTPEQVAAWTAVSRVLLNLDETITKE